MKKPKLTSELKKIFDEALLSSDDDEYVAYMISSKAMIDMQKGDGKPSIQRFRNLHRLRHFARIDPNAAYNLGVYLSDSAKRCEGRYDLRQKAADWAHRKTVELCTLRLDDPYSPFEEATDSEKDVRQVMSMALTNIGAELANTMQSKKAEDYFRRAIIAYPNNENAHGCLGNVGIFHFGKNTVGPLEAIQAWEESERLGLPASGFLDEVNLHTLNTRKARARVVRIFRSIESQSNLENAITWLSRRFQEKLSGKFDVQNLADIVVDPLNLYSASNGWFSHETANVASTAMRAVGPLRECRLEERVTLAGCILSGLARERSPDLTGGSEILWDAVNNAAGIEAFSPFLGIHDWEEKRPPETLYLTLREESLQYIEIADAVVQVISELHPNASRDELVMGFMFLLDESFRGGVCSMISNVMDSRPRGMVYVPAVQVG